MNIFCSWKHCHGSLPESMSLPNNSTFRNLYPCKSSPIQHQRSNHPLILLDAESTVDKYTNSLGQDIPCTVQTDQCWVDVKTLPTIQVSIHYQDSVPICVQTAPSSKIPSSPRFTLSWSLRHPTAASHNHSHSGCL